MLGKDSRDRRGAWRLAAGWLALALGANSATAEVKVPALFTPHMVLQQNQADRVWGWADPGEEVTVAFADQKKTAKADDKGAWSVTLDPLKASAEPRTLTIRGKNTIEIGDVLVGEVWVCSGQSNMQWDVNLANDPDLESLAASFPQIRLISVPQIGTQETRNDFQGAWAVCTPETVRGFSAVGFFFGRQLHQTLGVPVGLIDNAWGGSACEAWIRRDILEKDETYKALMDRWAGMEKQFAELEKSPPADGSEAAKQFANLRNLMAGNARPANIYNGVLRPTIGYGIKGAIWYQGESNASRAYQYRALFPLMIKSWRDEWGLGDFPFYYVQLADFMAEKPEPSESAWAELREAQTLTMDALPKVGQAVIIDIGEGKDIHPRNKQDVAKRLARWALANDYGVQVPFRSPQLASAEKQGNKMVIKLKHADGGLRTFDVPDPRGFTIAASDRKFVPAQARITGPDTIEVWSDAVSDPASVRYAWADNPVCNVFSNAGLPLTPFRTDDWPGVTADAK
jgi:sialate O-acetylesterase